MLGRQLVAPTTSSRAHPQQNGEFKREGVGPPAAKKLETRRAVDANAENGRIGGELLNLLPQLVAEINVNYCNIAILQYCKIAIAEHAGRQSAQSYR